METKQRPELIQVPVANLEPLQIGQEASLHSGITFLPAQAQGEIIYRAPTFWRSGTLRAAGLLTLQKVTETTTIEHRENREIQASLPSDFSAWLGSHLLRKKEDMVCCVLTRPRPVHERVPMQRHHPSIS